MTKPLSKCITVGSLAANRYGLYDMEGNVGQWCEDWSDSKRVYRGLRGGSRSDALPPAPRSSLMAGSVIY